MEKTIFEQMGGTYAQAGDYNLPSLILSNEESKPIGIWGQRHARYLKQNRKVLYMNLLTSGQLNAYLANIDKQAQERFERLIDGMKQTQGITEQLKAENALEWVGRMNNIRGVCDGDCERGNHLHLKHCNAYNRKIVTGSDNTLLII